MLHYTITDFFARSVDFVQLIDIVLVGWQSFLVNVFNASLRAKCSLSIRHNNGMVQTEELLSVLIVHDWGAARIYCLQIAFVLSYITD